MNQSVMRAKIRRWSKNQTGMRWGVNPRFFILQKVTIAVILGYNQFVNIGNFHISLKQVMDSKFKI